MFGHVWSPDEGISVLKTLIQKGGCNRRYPKRAKLALRILAAPLTEELEDTDQESPFERDGEGVQKLVERKCVAAVRLLPHLINERCLLFQRNKRSRRFPASL
jgi:hypothetical protein